MERLVSACFGLVLVVLVLPGHNAYSQSGCPFADSVAVADTLDPKGYYPAQIGNVWEYTDMSGSGFMEDPFREEIVADTLIDGMTFYKLMITTFDYDFSPVITRSHTHFSYFAVVDSGIVQWLPDATILNDIRFSQPFNSCYGSNPVEVAGGYGASFSIMEGDSVVTRVLPARKTFTIPSAFSEVTYGYEVGRLQTVGDPSVTYDLSYAKIDGRELGTPLDSLFTIVVSVEDSPALPRQQPRLQNYPNPFKVATHLSFSLTSPGRVSLRIMDILGRVIAQPLADTPFTSGTHVVTWEARRIPSGVYLAQLIVDGRYRTATQIVLIK